jgi:hypothetical protein
MASAMFDPGREGFLDGSIDWDTNDMRAMLVKTAYSFSAAHKFVSELTPASNDNGRTTALGTKTVANGVAGAANTSLTATAAAACNAIVVYQYNAADAAARLICYIDSGTGLPFTPAAGQTVNINWDTGANKIFKL